MLRKKILPRLLPYFLRWQICIDGRWIEVQYLPTPLVDTCITRLGSSWQTCSLFIALLSLPLTVALLWLLKDWAPTQPVLTGLVAGLVSGSFAAVLYSLHCTETGYGFFSIWYALGILTSCAVGAYLGQRYLRW
jgi:hypothetical protein